MRTAVNGLVVAHILEAEQGFALDHGVGDIFFQQCIEEIFGQLAHGTVQEFRLVVVHFEAGQLRVRRDQDPVPKPILATEHDGLFGFADGRIYLVVGNVPFFHGAALQWVWEVSNSRCSSSI